MPDLNDEDKIAIYDLVAKDPALYRQLQRGLKKAHPEIQAPEVDMEDAIAAARADAEKQAAALREQLEAEKAARVAAEETARVKAKLGATDEDLVRAAKYMEDNHVGTIEDALRFERLENERAAAAPKYEDRTTMKLPSDFSKMLKDRRGARRARILDGIHDLQKAQRSAGFLSTAA